MSRASLKLAAARGAAVAAQDPINVTPPSLDKTSYAVGETATLYMGEWQFATSLTPEWLLDDVVAPGATGACYVFTAEDEGKVPEGRVVALGPSGVPVSATSAPADAVGPYVPPDPVLPVSVTVRFLPGTRGGLGGHRCGYGGDGYLKVTGPAAAYVTFDDLKELVPVGSFNAAPPSWSPGASYSGTITEYADTGMTTPTGRTSALTLAVASTAGCTITWRSGSAANNDSTSTTGTNNSQLKMALNANPGLGYVIEIRDGAVLNPNGQSWYLRTTYTAAQTAARAAAFTGENHVVIRPETPMGAIIRCVRFDGQRLHRVDYIRLQHVRAELTSASEQTISSAVACISEGGGADHIDIWDCDISSTPNSEYGRDQFSGIYTSNTARRWRVRRNKVHDVAGGIYLKNMETKFDFGTAWSALPTGQADHHDSADCFHEVSENEIYRVANDEINITNATGAKVFGNVLYDKVTGVLPWDALTAQQKLTQNSPYDTNVQPHGDGASFDYSSCVFGSVDAPKIWNNTFSRGLGRDTMPFYTSPPYPAPDSKGYTPSAAAVYNSSQGVWLTNNDPGKASRPGGYPTILVGLEVVACTYNRDMVNGLIASYVENPIIENNSIMGCKNVPTANFITSAGKITVTNISGTAGRIRRNISNGPSITVSYAAGGALAAFGENIFVSYSATSGDTAYGSVWNDPVDGPPLRSLADWSAHYRPKAGGPADQANPIGAFNTSGEFVQIYAA